MWWAPLISDQRTRPKKEEAEQQAKKILPHVDDDEKLIAEMVGMSRCCVQLAEGKEKLHEKIRPCLASQASGLGGKSKHQVDRSYRQSIPCTAGPKVLRAPLETGPRQGGHGHLPKFGWPSLI